MTDQNPINTLGCKIDFFYKRLDKLTDASIKERYDNEELTDKYFRLGSLCGKVARKLSELNKQYKALLEAQR